MEGRYSTRSPAVKRLMREAQELCEPTDQYFAQPLEDNLFEWHFTIRGPIDSDFQAGIYHGRIILPVDYPMKPPSIIWLTPNGRFETNKKICLSISGHHPESWQPSWSIRTALLAIIGFMPTHPGGAIGSLDYKPEERKALAKKSRDWKCPVCGDVSEILLEPSPESSQTSQEAKELATQISFQGEKPKSPEKKSTEVTAANSPPSTITVSNAEGASNNASTCIPQSTSQINELPTPENIAQNPGLFYPPWNYPPVASCFNNAIPPPFLHNPFTSHVMTSDEQFRNVASHIPRFPYPPSYYACTGNTQFYPAGLAFPPMMGMFPCPFPPPPKLNHSQISPGKNQSVSVNNSSAASPIQNSDTGNQSHSPDTPVIPNIPPPSPASLVSTPASSSLTGSPHSGPLKLHVLNELLDRVKRVGSNEQIQLSDVAESEETGLHSESAIEPVSAEVISASVQDKSEADSLHHVSAVKEVIGSQNRSETKAGEITAQLRSVESDQSCSTGFMVNTSRIVNLPTPSEALNSAFDEERVAVGNNGAEMSHAAVRNIGDHYVTEDNNDKSQITDNDVSVSLMRKESLNESTGMEISHSELLAEEVGEREMLGFEMSDAEQRSNFERNVSTSMPDLKKKLKQGSLKGLRQRQSATAQMPTDFSGGEQTPSEQVSSGGGRLRIEAVSGDSTSANQPRFHHNGAHGIDGEHNQANEVQHTHRRVRGRQVQSTYDATFFVMLGLCVTTVFLILNRLFYMVDFSEVFY